MLLVVIVESRSDTESRSVTNSLILEWSCSCKTTPQLSEVGSRICEVGLREVLVPVASACADVGERPTRQRGTVRPAQESW
jgi:hypothetical protein